MEKNFRMNKQETHSMSQYITHTKGQCRFNSPYLCFNILDKIFKDGNHISYNVQYL